MSAGKAILDTLRTQDDLHDYRRLHWEGTFSDYLDIVLERPEITRNAYQRLYDMILSHGVNEVYENKEKVLRYKFFSDYAPQYGEQIFGIDRTLTQLVNTFKSAAQGYGTERRVLLLHGPVGSAKSTIARLLKRGLEEYSKTDAGMLYSYAWKMPDGTLSKCPMHEEPLHLIPRDYRNEFLGKLNAGRRTEHHEIVIRGDVCPFCRLMFSERLASHQGDWQQVLRDIQVFRLVLSEQDRIGIGTFQPKDEKNQDSTELTGDINYRKIAEYGTDSDARCVIGSTTIATGGGLRSVGSLLPFVPEADTFTPQPMAVSSIAPATVSHSDSVYYAGVKPVRTISTRMGYKLSASHNHMVLSLTADGEPVWKQLRLVEPGDYVALGRGIHTWPTTDCVLPPAPVRTAYGNERHNPRFPTQMTPALARFIGLWVGDGHLSVNEGKRQYELGWTQKEDGRRTDFIALMEELFGVEARDDDRGDHAGMVRIGCRTLCEWLIGTLGFGEKARTKSVPDCVLRSTRESVLACLGGLWETDGTVRCGGGSNWAMFVSASQILTKQVHLILLANGIVSSLKKVPGAWEVRVYGRDVNRLVELLPQLKERFTVGALADSVGSPNVGGLPHIKPRLEGIYQRSLNRDELERRFSGTLHDSKKPTISLRVAGDFLDSVRPSPEDEAEVSRFRQLLTDDHAWLAITEIADSDAVGVYDLSVTPTHAFWADGFICHNCFNFDGELNIANRGLVEFIEVLKLDVAFLYDLLGASQEHKIKPKKFAQTDIDEVILGHSVAGNTPISYRLDGEIRWSTLETMYEDHADNPEGLEVLAHDFEAGRSVWTPVVDLFRHRYTGPMLTTSQKWGTVETTPNHSIVGRDGEPFFPGERREVMAVRGLDLGESVSTDVIDVLAGIPGFVREEVAVTSAGGKMTKACEAGWGRLDLPRHATAIRAEYDPVVDVAALKDLITVAVWYATEGHVNGQKGVVISQANPAELERVRLAFANITTAKGSIHSGAKTDSAWRLYLGSKAIRAFLIHHCGRLSPRKRLPDFLFRLPTAYLQHAFDELMRTDGTRKTQGELTRASSEDYRAKFFEYKTISPVLAAQVGTLATMLGHDYSVYQRQRAGKLPTYRVRFCAGYGKRGGRRLTFISHLHERSAADEWVYDIECAGIHNFVCGVGNVVCHNTNDPEFRRLQNNEFMEALRDRTVKIDVPYNTRLADEVRIYEKDFNATRVKGKHIAPHTIEVAAMWAILTRLVQPRNASLTLLQKLKLYNGKTLPGFTEDNVIDLRRESADEGMHGISPRYIQDKISNALVVHPDEDNINPFMVMHELEVGLRHHALISDEETLKHYRELLSVVREEYEDIVKNEVQRAIAADEDALTRLCGNYIDNVKAYTQREKVRNRFTGNYEEPDERLMRSVEEKIDIPESRKDDFRREIMNYIGALAVDGRKFDYRTNERLQKALELKLFEDQKDTIKLTSLVSNVVDKATQEKIDVVKSRLIRNYGYNDSSATDVLTFVASIFARGQTRK